MFVFRRSNQVLLIILILLLPATGQGQNPVQAEKNQITLGEAFKKIEQQSNFSIVYNQSKLDDTKYVTYPARSENTEEVLRSILKGSGWSYIINGNHIIIVELPEQPKETPVQNIRGVVVDAESRLPVPYALVEVLSLTNRSVTADSSGCFSLKKLPVGRYDLQGSMLGYESYIIKEILLTSSKEIFLEIPLTERIYNLEEVVVTARVNKQEPLDPMVLAGGRMFSVEEASRYAGGFDDPARLAGSFAGVSAGIGSNALSVHGNLPHMLQWRLEDIEIPNPNHFTNLSTRGGGVFTALSSNVLANSGFLTGAFPAEYNNALSGVFDLKLRKGNNQRFEHTIQASLMGIDLASEGPLKDKGKASYLFNYRNSSLNLIKKYVPSLNTDDLAFQDLSFRLYFPTSQMGDFSVWGLGLYDKSEPVEPPVDSHFSSSSIQYGKQYMSVGGLGHSYFFKNGILLKSTLGLIFQGSDLNRKTVFNKTSEVIDKTLRDQEYNLNFTTSINHKFSARHTNKSGFTWKSMFYDYDGNNASGENKQNRTEGNGFGSANYISFYSNSLLTIAENLKSSIGFNYQLFTLSNSWSLEPRMGMKWNISPKHSIGLAYGLHSRMEYLSSYFIGANQELDFMKAHEFSLEYTWKISDNSCLKIEPYYQYLFQIPVSSYALSASNIFNESHLTNRGTGQNYGVDLTLERYLANGFYYMLAGSVFDATYRVQEEVWEDSRYKRQFLLKLLGGKEWRFGKNKQHGLGINGRLIWQGGDRYIPIDEDLTNERQDIFIKSEGYNEQLPSQLIVDFSIAYRFNAKKVTHGLDFKIINTTGALEYAGHDYNQDRHAVEMKQIKTILPNISYKITF